MRVKIRPRKACNYPNFISSAWVSYDKVGVLCSGKLGNRSEARASDLRSYPGLWWKRIKLHLYEGNESEYSPRICSIGRPAGGTLCPPLYFNMWHRRQDNACYDGGIPFFGENVFWMTGLLNPQNRRNYAIFFSHVVDGFSLGTLEAMGFFIRYHIIGIVVLFSS